MSGYCYNGIGVYGTSGVTENGYAAYLNGRVYISGPLEKPSGSFKIDHPLDPANKYLHHSFLESPHMKNVYDGVVSLDDKGEAEIQLPDWFLHSMRVFGISLLLLEPLNQICILQREISGITINDSSIRNGSNTSNFKIAGGVSGMKVSWQVTGIRKDPWANAHRIEVDEDKCDKEIGYY